MCGIVGFIGKQNAKEVILNGLKSMEYRGYDSAGIAINMKDRIEVRKHVGGIENLEKITRDVEFDGKQGIGHTRWATHGVPATVNAHPHLSQDGEIAIVHNGIIENYAEIKDWLIGEFGVKFASETDSEVIAQLISVYYEGDLHKAVNKAVKKLRGAYAIAVIAHDEPDKIVAVRKDAPLVAGIGKGCNFIASDIPALLKYVREIYLIENNETLVLTKDDIKIYDKDGNEIKRDVYHVNWDADAAEKSGYEHFMIKEIHEQPEVIGETLNRRLDENDRIKIDGISLSKEEINQFDKVYIVACGTAYFAGLVGKYLIEKIAKIPVEVDVASEFRYRDPLVDDKTLLIAISQSGETLDTLEALREGKRKGARVLSVVNVVGSSVARESDDVFYTWAGPEISVASTKAYTTQLMCMYILALYIGEVKGSISDEYYNKIISELKSTPEKLQAVLDRKGEVETLANIFYSRNDIFFIGRGLDSCVSYEGSLKLKEVSYINSLAITAGELKHGTIALVEDDTLIFALASQDFLFEKMLSNIEEVKTRGARVVGIAKKSQNAIQSKADEVIFIPDCADEITPLLTVVPLQLFAYYVAKRRGTNVDKPKNLAKSVTVE
ncbi:MAG: glutamine--fructose-6-phosphate transaminase (isomerizing) [[Eubacterium] brachy]|jgi:glutamine-fructose-6-phosphate transaminase (isomerizing)|nr:glutamine--fructose-6-phosphate transaminase (isomerizing) [[Eubacterium] brachy]